jgi:hypothetical protein
MILKAKHLKGAHIMTYDEAMKAYKDECDEIARECKEEGYPSNGSNYELRAQQAYNYYMSLIDDE